MRLLRFLAAVAVAVFFALLRWDRPLMRLSDGLRLFLSTKTNPPASPALVAVRMSACARCPIFFRPLRTCGTPIFKKDADLGCFCYMPLKARLSNATCWSRDKGVKDYGWPDELIEHNPNSSAGKDPG